ncbi:hypothetical protein ECG_07833 [Echinococcus granulosus]|uniref:Expressed conserved protein n=1 Tax=Echinococcus granulosus TaxID=6210 RepID=A0A068WX96_ECHGR|nr:hypothetical protein ECG_07833 [Echinococcus granulosus]CDS22267.1 expressed conserved protein [Echinococcus granulosus]
MSVFEMDRTLCNSPTAAPKEDLCRPKQNYAQAAGGGNNPCEMQRQQRPQYMPQQQQQMGCYNSRQYASSPYGGGGGGPCGPDYGRQQASAGAGGYCYGGQTNPGNFCSPRPQQSPGNFYGGNMYGNPCQPPPQQVGGACAPPCPPPPSTAVTCPPDYCEPRDPTNTGPMALVNLTQNTAGLGFQSCQKGPKGGVDNSPCWGMGSGGQGMKQKPVAELDLSGNVDEKARQKAELRIKMLIRDVLGPEIQRKEKEIEDNEKANEQLFANYRAANAFKDGCLNSSVFQRKPIRNYEVCEEEMIKRLKGINSCGKEAAPCPNFKEKKQTLLDSISESYQYLDSYKRALERSNAALAPGCQQQNASFLQTTQNWIDNGLFSHEELVCLRWQEGKITYFKNIHYPRY